MHEVEVMHWGGGRRGYRIQRYLSLSWVSAFCTFMAKYVAFRKMCADSLKMPLGIPEECHLGLASLDLYYVAHCKEIDL